MTIAPGTLCLLVDPHPDAGMTVSVVEHVGPTPCYRGLHLYPGVDVYIIAGRPAPDGWLLNGQRWGAERVELMPLTPPPGTDVGDIGRDLIEQQPTNEPARTA